MSNQPLHVSVKSHTSTSNNLKKKKKRCIFKIHDFSILLKHLGLFNLSCSTFFSINLTNTPTHRLSSSVIYFIPLQLSSISIVLIQLSLSVSLSLCLSVSLSLCLSVSLSLFSYLLTIIRTIFFTFVF
jgi:hypothetical protein